MKNLFRGAIGIALAVGLLGTAGAAAGAQSTDPADRFTGVDLLAGNTSTVARTADGRAVTTPGVAAEVESYWTPARMAAAEAAELEVASPTEDPTRSAPAPAGRPGAVRPAAPTISTVDSAPLAEVESITIDGVGTLQLTETRTVGRVFFTRPDGTSGSCSASTVNSPKRRLVMTAGHCVHDRNRGGWFTNWQFVPRYRDGNRPFGTWTARQLTSRTAWVNNRDSNEDMGIAIMNNNATNQTVVGVLGGNGLRWNSGYSNPVTIFGYPADPPYDGSIQYTCQGTTWHGHEQQVRAWCAMTGGSSGGPWFQDFNNSTGYGYINSVVSHRHANQSQMDGPYFGNNVKSLYDYAEGLTP